MTASTSKKWTRRDIKSLRGAIGSWWLHNSRYLRHGVTKAEVFAAMPAGERVATDCCVCGRALVDADSVECGIGPICRKKTEPDVAPDWSAVIEQLGQWVAEDQADDQRRIMFEHAMSQLDPTTKIPVDERKMANILTRHIAAVQHQDDRRVGHLVMAIRLMGRHRLADAIASRLYEIRIREEAEDLLVRAPYSNDFHARVPGRWDNDRDCYRVPAARRPELATALRSAFAGVLGFGPKGEFALAAA